MRVRASSLIYRDLMVLKGGGRGPTKLGVIPLSDGAGEVAAVGDGVTRVRVGDRIDGCFHPRWFGGPIRPDYLTDRLGANLDGMLAEYAVLSEEALVRVPSHLSFEEAATLPCAAVTAWVALTGHRKVTAGDTVLTQGSVATARAQDAILHMSTIRATLSQLPPSTIISMFNITSSQNHAARFPDRSERAAAGRSHISITPDRLGLWFVRHRLP
jgi:D-arabinose 1-dehydrogenase-like Zn-dependent alcohol dehydrogenase